MRQKAQRRLSRSLSLIVRGPGGSSEAAASSQETLHRQPRTTFSSSKYFVPAKGMFCCEIAKDGTIAESPASDQGDWKVRGSYTCIRTLAIYLTLLAQSRIRQKQPMDPSRSSARTFSQPEHVPSEARNAMPATKVCALHKRADPVSLHPDPGRACPPRHLFRVIEPLGSRQSAHTPCAVYGAHIELPNLLSGAPTPDRAEPGLAGGRKGKKERLTRIALGCSQDQLDRHLKRCRLPTSGRVRANKGR